MSTTLERATAAVDLLLHPTLPHVGLASDIPTSRDLAKAALDAAAAGDPEPDVACDIHGVGCTPDSETCAGPWGARCRLPEGHLDVPQTEPAEVTS